MQTLRLIRRLKRILSWLPVLWHDEDWDHAHLWHILRHKLSSMRDYHKEYGISADRLQIALEINSCVEALDRLIDDDYLSGDWDAFHKKYPMQFESVRGENYSRVIPLPEEGREQFSRLVADEDAARQLDSAFVTNTLHKHWFGWWD